MRSAPLFAIILAGSIGLAGWTYGWHWKQRAGAPINPDAAFAALESETIALRKENDELREQVARLQLGASEGILLPPPVLAYLKDEYHVTPEQLPPVLPASPEASNRLAREHLAKIPGETELELLHRCGLISSPDSFVRQLAFLELENARALSIGGSLILVAEDFDPESLRDQADLLGELIAYLARTTDNQESKIKDQRSPSPLELELASQALGAFEKSRFLFYRARANDTFLPRNASNPLKDGEFDPAVASTLQHRAALQLRFIPKLKSGLKQSGAPLSLDTFLAALAQDPDSPRQLSFPRLVATALLDSPELSAHISAATLAPGPVLTLSSSDTPALKQSLTSYFTDWPVDHFGQPPALSADSEAVSLRFP